MQKSGIMSLAVQGTTLCASLDLGDSRTSGSFQPQAVFANQSEDSTATRLSVSRFEQHTKPEDNCLLGRDAV
jgi:hypothetical protein